MATYRMDGGTIVDTDKASATWKEYAPHDGRNFISINTGSQWEHEQLYRSRKGRYYLERWSDWQGTRASAEWISNAEAARWLILNHRDVPEDLQEHVEEVTE